ncbi:MAG TPA: aspartate kinase [Polyangiaceae bacterium]|nr:aspartate kinase [Polyangiaceae bacterium]
MGLVVRKYGGSSLADLPKLQAVADQLAARHRAAQPTVVVVSAMGKTTEELLALARAAAEQASAGAGPGRRELDMLVSTGERVSMALLAIALQARGVPAVSFTGSQAGIITTEHHFDARILEIRPDRVRAELSQGRVVIVAGYQGVSRAREITTLGRGGSDTTAVALAAALGAERCEIYSDVDGVYSADPRRIPQARHLPRVDHACMQEAAEQGARVLNARAVEWARRHGVVVHARRTSDGESGKQTLVAPATTATPAIIVADPDVAVLRAPMAASRALLDRLDRHGLALRGASFTDTEARLLVSSANAPLAVLDAPSAIVERDYGTVSVVMPGFDRPGQVARALSVLDAPPAGVFASPLRVTCLIERERVPAAERALHAAFAEGAPHLPLAC